MRNRKRLAGVIAAGALLVGLAFGIGPLVHAADVRGNGKEQGKVGDLCKTNSDCEQKPRPLICREADGESKCFAMPIRPVT